MKMMSAADYAPFSTNITSSFPSQVAKRYHVDMPTDGHSSIRLLSPIGMLLRHEIMSFGCWRIVGAETRMKVKNEAGDPAPACCSRDSRDGASLVARPD
jgi:hypothetical protein